MRLKDPVLLVAVLARLVHTSAEDIKVTNRNEFLQVKGKQFVNITSLIISYNQITDAEFDFIFGNLNSVEKGITISRAGFVQVNLPKLTFVGGDFSIQYCASLLELSCPLLAKAGATMTISNNNLLSKISFPSLAVVIGALRIQNSNQLDNINLNTLNDAFSMYDSGNCDIYHITKGIYIYVLYISP
eukprot:m.316335 g.316335  ORF g.316335 m.316335 type:complete len:187 (+) comp16502_c0_seq12:51-611(+)